MTTIKNGDTVKVHYTGKLDDGTVFDSSSGRDPLEFTLGTQSVIAGFENGVVGLGVGEKRTISIAPEEGYGQYTTELVATVNRSQLPANLKPAPGMVLQSDSPQGPLKFMVTEVEGDQRTLDGNHPLAGKRLRFDLEIVAIISP
jgi:FKBP-type peptidyl-prolyl cis-trans isomerase 2